MSGPRIDFLDQFVNPFDNADMRFFQRAIGKTGTGSSQIADRFRIATSLATSYTQDKSSVAPGIADGMPYPLRNSVFFSPLATTTPLAGTIMSTFNFMEHGRSTWLSYKKTKYGFWYKTNKAGTYTINMLMTGAAYILKFEPIADDAWHTFTFDIDPTPGLAIGGAPLLDTDFGMLFSIALSAGPDLTGVFPENTWAAQTIISGTSIKAVAGQVNFFDSTANEFRITGFRAAPIFYDGQEIDLWAAPPLGSSQDLANCQRYYEKSYEVEVPVGTGPYGRGAVSYSTPTTFYRSFANFRVSKRVENSIVVAYNPFNGTLHQAARDNQLSTPTIGSYSASTEGFHAQGATHVADVEYRYNWSADCDF